MVDEVQKTAEHEKRIAQLEALLAQQATFNDKLLGILLQHQAILMPPEKQSKIHVPKLIGLNS